MKLLISSLLNESLVSTSRCFPCLRTFSLVCCYYLPVVILYFSFIYEGHVVVSSRQQRDLRGFKSTFFLTDPLTDRNQHQSSYFPHKHSLPVKSRIESNSTTKRHHILKKAHGKHMFPGCRAAAGPQNLLN